MFLLAWLAAVSLVVAGPASAQTTPKQLDYVEHVSGGADPNEPLPMLVAIHGLGGKPEEFVPIFETLSIKARLIAPRAPTPAGEGGSWYPIDSDVEARTKGIVASALRLSALIEVLTKSRPTLGKPVVTGFSQGGVLSFALAAYYAPQLSAAVPLAGSLPVDLPPPMKPPAGFVVRAFHGKDDQRIPYQDGVRTVAWLKRAKVTATIKGYAGVAHALSDSMREQAKREITRLLTLAAKRSA